MARQDTSSEDPGQVFSDKTAPHMVYQPQSGANINSNLASGLVGNSSLAVNSAYGRRVPVGTEP